MLTITALIICSAAALAGGFIDAIAGGGGLLTVPALLLCGVPPHVTLGVNKVSACMGTTVALFNFSRNHLVNWHVAFYGIWFSLAGSWLGSLLAMRLSTEILGKIIVMLLPVAMLTALLPAKNIHEKKLSAASLRFRLGTPLICLAIGAYDGFFGPGTGSFLIIALHLFLHTGYVESTATAKAFNLASNISAAISFIWHGVVIWPLAISMGAFFIIGNWAGSAFAIKIGEKAVRRVLLFSLALLMASLIWRYFIQE